MSADSRVSRPAFPWLIILAGSLVVMLTFGPRSAMGLYQLPLLNDTGWDRSTFGLALAIQNLCWGLGQPFFGAYGATKAAQMALARSWQAEATKHGPRVLIAEPAPMPTATRARFPPGEDRSKLADIRSEASRLLDLI